MTCTNSILAGSNSSNDNPFDCRSHGGVRRHIWIYTTNHIGIMHDDVSILCTCIKGFRERHKINLQANILMYTNNCLSLMV